ncbi:MAG: PQQ-dependent sugar dehydrogenase, partial [Flavobacteriaceae bacterium]
GEVLLYKDATGELSEIAKLDVYHKTLNTPGVNAEEGLMGLQKDPNFEQNRWVYMYYAPTGDKWVNRLSRFKFENDALDMASEQVILEVDSQREICCHTGGSIAFGPKGLLYLSTGDNSTPFDEEGAKYVNRGYAPLNDLPGKQQYDARRSSGNTNDLRGKILRIKVNEDGSYDIPEGNLFPVGMEKTRPEIYTMGHRNPYRISVDMKRGYLYWGDVGPDAGADSLMTRGPRGYDEMNQARGPGNFGWPLFIGDNFAYRDYDYGTGVHGEPFDPERPINDSENNTGLRELPPAQPAYMYYPYADIQDFPQVGSGGRNAMAGPTYWSELFANGGGLPAYYDGKVIIYEWMRGWMMAVHLFEDGSFNKVEPFASDIKVNSLIDMELGPDGRLYLLEYGSGWFSANSDSSLGYVEFNGGNRPPVIDGLLVDADSGSLPLTVTATVEAHDREGDAITYLWDMGDGTTKETTDPKVTHEYTTKGDYTLRVTAKDAQGEEVQSTPQGIVVGNNRPQVKIAIQQANASFYVPGKPIDYTVTVNDPDGEVNEDNVYVSVEYRTGMDAANTNLGHQQVAASVTGKALTQSLDCKACHKEKDASIGPSYRAISKKYKGQQRAVDYVMTKIVNGGSGVWGEVTMPAHPTVTEDEARQMALYIQSLSGDDTRKPTLPMSGSVTPEASQGGKTLLLTASYTDEGVEGTMPLTGSNTVVLKSNTLSFPEETEVEGMQPVAFNGMDLLLVTAPHGWWRIPEIDMTGVSAVVVTVGWQAPPSAGYTFEVREGTPTGTLLGTGEMPTTSAGQPAGMAMIPIAQPTEKVEGLYILFKANGVADVPVAIINATFN